MLNNSDEAKDVLQESFISAFKNINQYSGHGSFGSWLKRIVINKSIDTIRKRDLFLVPLSEDIMEEEAGEETVNYDPEHIRTAVAALPNGYRVILSLFLFEDHTHKMIAEKLKISEGTSKSQYARAKKKLIELIKQSHHER